MIQLPDAAPGFALSRCMRPGDYELLSEELKVVEDTMSIHSGGHWAQHVHRRWEYALLLRALSETGHLNLNGARVADIGCSVGLTSALVMRLGGEPYMTEIWELQDESWRTFQVAQMEFAKLRWGGKYTLAFENIHDGGHEMEFPVVLCVSTLEHMRSAETAFRNLLKMVSPGGLLFLTMDFAEDGSVDDYQYKELRTQIFDEKKMLGLAEIAHGFGFRAARVHEGWPVVDYSWGGAMVNNYSFCSLVLERRNG